MRYLKIGVILLFLLLVLLFIFQNSASLAAAIELKYGFGEYVLQKEIPLYLVIFCALFLGSAMVAFLDIVIIFKNRRQLKKQNKTISELESELAKFRNQPLTETPVAVASETNAPAPKEEVTTTAVN
ncbi:LapA family protein [bacterium]|nr:LapA family protein [bacterium]